MPGFTPKRPPCPLKSVYRRFDGGLGGLAKGKAEPIQGSLVDVLGTIHKNGHQHIYIDGGLTIQSFLKEDLIDEMVITVIPVLLGGGTPLFGELPKPTEFEHLKTDVFLNAIVQYHYLRKK